MLNRKLIESSDSIRAPADPMVAPLLYVLTQLGYEPEPRKFPAPRETPGKSITVVCKRCGEDFITAHHLNSHARFCPRCKRY